MTDLPLNFATWLDDFVRVAGAASMDSPGEITQRLIYVLVPIRDDPRMPQLGVQPVLARLRKDGTIASNSKPYPADSAALDSPEYFLPLDGRILHELRFLPTVGPMAFYRLTNDVGAEVLSLILATDRSVWLTRAGPALRAGPARRGILSWDEAGVGVLLPQLTVDGEGMVLAATPPVYVDPAAGLVGSVETGYEPSIVAALFQAPPVAVTSLATLSEEMVRRAPALAILVPPVSAVERRRGLRPVPCLRLFTAPLPPGRDGGTPRYDGPFALASFAEEPVALARLCFRYGDVVTSTGETKRTVTVYSGGRLVEVQRNATVEAEATQLLLSQGFCSVSEIRDGVPAKHARDFVPGNDPAEWLAVLHDVVPGLRAVGWNVTVAPDFPYRVVRADGEVEAELRESSGVDWLELHLGVIVEGERVDLIEPLVALIGSSGLSPGPLDSSEADIDETFFLPLADGRVLAMPLARLRPMVDSMRDLAFGPDRTAGALRLSTLDAAALAMFEAATAGAALRWSGGHAIRELGRKLTDAGGIPPVAIPPEFLATLRPYQIEGVAWLLLLLHVGLGGILADDMGLGKTMQALALLSIEKAAGRLDRPALIVAPTSLIQNWAHEAARFAPALRVLTLHGSARRALFDSITEHDLVLTSYPLVARDREVLAAQHWHVLLLDEAQTIKNP